MTPQPPYGMPPQPPRKRHTFRNITLGSVAGVAVLIALGAALGSSKTPPAAGTPAPSGTVSAPASPSSTPAGVGGLTAVPVKRVLIRFTGSGIENSAPFNVGSGPLTVKYTFSCASFGQSGNFVADLLYGNQSSMNSDDDPIANALAMSGSTTTTVYPQDPGKDYYLAVDSECTFRIKVSS